MQHIIGMYNTSQVYEIGRLLAFFLLLLFINWENTTMGTQEKEEKRRKRVVIVSVNMCKGGVSVQVKTGHMITRISGITTNTTNNTIE